MGRIRILIDVDGVICDFVTAYLDSYKELGGIVPGDFVWDGWAAMEKLPNYDTLNEHVWEDPELFLRPLPYPGAIDALKALNKKHDVRIVTAVPHIHVYARSLWFAENAPFIHRKNQIIFTNDKSLVRGDIFVDDYLPHVYAWMKVNVHTGVIIDRLWNKGDGGPEAYMRLDSLASLAERLTL